ncbi:MAG: peptidoglycan DD-metalloendopeptidase family protein [Rickettsiales bacterium]|nr:peptidoglycan DD-metalloendopeptidase family protein [Rickettsiales bacterium]
MYRLLAAASISCLLAAPLWASPKDDLEQTTTQLEESKARQKEIAQERSKLENELAALQRRLVGAAANVRSSEGDLSASEDKLRILNEQSSLKKDTLAKRKMHLQTLINAALKLSQTPPEAMIMMPEGTMETMRAANAMKMTADTVKQEIVAIDTQVKELARLEDKILRRRNDVAGKQANLDSERKALEQKIAERKLLQSKLSSEESQEKEKITQLAKKADDLQDLIEGLEKAEKEKQRKSRDRKAKARSFAASKGHITMPASGSITQGFGSSGQSDTSKGIVISPRKSAQIVAPFDGEVVFAGPFLSYGRMIILRHGKEFHSLLAGMAKIDVAVGDFLLEGEPIGAMGNDSDNKNLYFELRKNNQPIDPKPWLNN